ncbi:hypothetical protein D910_01981 [Dendroctonus ponderosae]
MTRGNQRDLARAKNQKKQQEQGRGKKNDGLTVEQRKFRYLNPSSEDKADGNIFQVHVTLENNY